MALALHKLDSYHQTQKGSLLFGVIEFAAAFLLVSRALDTGSLWQYGLATALFIGAMSNFVKCMRLTIKPHEKPRTKAKRS